MTTRVITQHTDIAEYMRIECEDISTQNMMQFFPETCKFIHDALSANSTNKVLVHCNMGMSRSGSVVIAYMLQQNPKWEFIECWSQARQLRKKIEPIPAF